MFFLSLYSIILIGILVNANIHVDPLKRQIRHCLHGCSFICNRIGLYAVIPFVYTALVEFVIRTRGGFENAFKSGAFSKRYGFIGHVNGETASI